MRKYYWFDIYLYSVNIGLKYLLNCFRGPINREGIKRLVIPMDMPRFFELSNTLQELCISGGERIFDLSSAKLLAAFISEKIGGEVVAVDMWAKEILRWKSLLSIAHSGKSFWKRRLLLGIMDGKALPFPDSTFDKIYSVSVVEHIPGDGDEKAVKELARILKPGGILVLTVPFSNSHREFYIDKNVYGEKRKDEGKVFFARYYDEDSLKRRVIDASNLQLDKKQYFTEIIFPFNRFYARFFPMSMLLAPFFPFLYLINIREVPDKIIRGDKMYSQGTHVSITLRKRTPTCQEVRSDVND